ncbi:MAG: hypothetical protein GY740_12880, partial [Gammaproteobacteria bacterium]|nr:hypothetical protein [Gammaproteobacteria bacterium]
NVIDNPLRPFPHTEHKIQYIEFEKFDNESQISIKYIDTQREQWTPCAIDIVRTNGQLANNLYPTLENLTFVREAQMQDPYCKALIEYLDEKRLPVEDALRTTVDKEHQLFVLLSKVLWRDDGIFPELRIVVPPDHRNPLIKEAHDLPFSGHLGPRRTYKKLANLYFWPKMRQEIWNYCELCLPC